MKEKNMGTAMTEAATLVRAYYGSWQNGIATFDKERLTEILAEDLDFEGSIAGKRRGAAGFIIGLQRFVEGLKSPIQVQQQVEADDLAARTSARLTSQASCRRCWPAAFCSLTATAGCTSAS